MGACKDIQQLWRKKQSGVMRFLLRVRSWRDRQLSALHRAPRPTRPDKARRLGCKAPSYTESVCAAEAANAQFLRLPPTASLSTMILHTNSLRLSSLIHSIKLSEETLTLSGSPNHCAAWRRRSTLQLHRYH
uniref:Ribosomal protein L15 n=1 Tax=Moschus moschiferus TaxID=68415 RepID=A0A8C6D1U7_MOSMO